MRWLGKSLFWLSAIVLFVIVLGVFNLLMQTWREYDTIKNKEITIRQKLEQDKAILQAKEAYLKKALKDPEFLERIVRERLGYVKTGEQVYRFE